MPTLFAIYFLVKVERIIRQIFSLVNKREKKMIVPCCQAKLNFLIPLWRLSVCMQTIFFLHFLKKRDDGQDPLKFKKNFRYLFKVTLF